MRFSSYSREILDSIDFDDITDQFASVKENESAVKLNWLYYKLFFFIACNINLQFLQRQEASRTAFIIVFGLGLPQDHTW